ncbi:tyrosine-type recombinase/integrase [Agromyces sp. NPDC127015]|uniref:tyrosine-type recombinase/integrase n=1 Tax=Agromyces sp. NPDC127015 TaxID=3347108 RepID=UPI00365D39D0
MAWAQQKANGMWAGLYRLPDGSRRSAGVFSTEAKAKREAAALEADTRKPGWRDPRRGMMPWGDWYAEWSEARSIERTTTSNEASMVKNHVIEYWRDKPLIEITRFDVQAWATGLTRKNIGTASKPKYLATSSVRRVLNVFVSSMTAAMDAEKIDVNPAVRIKLPSIPPPDHVYLDRDQYAELVDKVPTEEEQAILDFLVSTGPRFGEMAGLHLNRFNGESNLAHFIDVWNGVEIKPFTKNGKGRHVPTMDWTFRHADIDALPQRSCGKPHRVGGTCRSVLLFQNRDGGPLDDRNFYRRTLEPALRRSKLDTLGFTLHDFRHTYASWLLQGGASLSRVGELLGHSSTKVTEIYAHLAQAVRSDVDDILVLPERSRTAERGAFGGQVVDFASRRVLREAR